MKILKFQNFKYLSYWDIKTPNQPSTIVVSCFIKKGNEILVLQRAKNDLQHLLWGIPGGKLEKHENPEEGLIREIIEETKITSINQATLHYLNKALSKTDCDGCYGLYIYFSEVSEDTMVSINKSEHYQYQWVNLSEFESLNLLTAQREAFLLVKNKLTNLIKESGYEDVARTK